MEELRRRILEALSGLAGSVPQSHRGQHLNPRQAAREEASRVAKKAAAISAASAVVPGLGVTALLVADLVAVIKLQQKMVADIAALYGKSQSLTREVMIGLLFKDSSPNAVRGLLVSHTGWGGSDAAALAKRSPSFVSRVLQKIAWGMARRIAGKAVARIIPVVGAAGAGIGSYRHTMAVGETAMAYFESRKPDGEPASAVAALTA